MPSIADAVTDVVHTLVDITYEFKKQGIPEPVDIYSFRFRHHGDGSPKNSTVKRRHSTATLPHPPRGDKKQNLRRYPSTQSLGRAQLKHECSSK